MNRELIAGLIALFSTLAVCAPASAQSRILDSLRQLTEDDEPSVQPNVQDTQEPSTQPTAPINFATTTGAGLSATFNVVLGEPPIAEARDQTCERVAATNPGELIRNVVGLQKERIVDTLRRRIIEDEDTEAQEAHVIDNARMEMKRQVWLPLAIEEAIGQRILEQRTGLIPEDDPAGADLYPPVQAVFDDLKTSTEGLQPYDLKLLIVDDGTGVPNAEALPGGTVFVNTSLAYSEPERVFAYLAHELGHIMKRHQTMALQAKVIDSATTVEALTQLTDLSGEALLERILVAVDLTAEVFTRYYTAQELEADACGAKFLAAVPSNDGAASIEMFLDDIGQSALIGEELEDQENKLVVEQHPSYDERASILTGNYLYWNSLE